MPTTTAPAQPAKRGDVLLVERTSTYTKANYDVVRHHQYTIGLVTATTRDGLAKAYQPTNAPAGTKFFIGEFNKYDHSVTSWSVAAASVLDMPALLAACAAMPYGDASFETREEAIAFMRQFKLGEPPPPALCEHGLLLEECRPCRSIAALQAIAHRNDWAARELAARGLPLMAGGSVGLICPACCAPLTDEAAFCGPDCAARYYDYTPSSTPATRAAVAKANGETPPTHTPGPWTSSAGLIVAKGHGVIAAYTGGPGSCIKYVGADEATANARLIANAPGMHSALKAIAEMSMQGGDHASLAALCIAIAKTALDPVGEV